MNRLLRVSWIAAIVLVAWAAPATGESLDVTIAQLEKTTAARLDDLAAWCTKKRVFGSRDDVYVALLRFEPDHRNARKRLRYEKGEDGAWVQHPKYRRAKNWSRKAAAEAETKLAAILAMHRDDVIRACEKTETVADLLAARRHVDGLSRSDPSDTCLPGVLRTVTMRIYRIMRTKGLVKEMAEAATSLRNHHPQDEEVRALLGEVSRDGVWVLAESARTMAKASGIAAAAKAALADVKTKPSKPLGTEGTIELPWSEAVETTEVRIAGTQKSEILAGIARSADATGALFHHALDRKPKRRAGLTAYVFAEKGEVDTFLAGYPVVANPTLVQRKKIKLDLCYANGRTLVLEPNPPEAQKDLVTNEVLNQIFADTFLASEAPKGWHAEGISRYLAWHLTGTRLSIAVSGKYAGQGGDRHVPGSGDAWLVMARSHVAKGTDLRLLLGKGLDVFTASDSMVAYAFAVYLLEGHEKVVADFVATLAKTADADRACREVLGMPRPVVEHRLKRWLDEVTAAERAAKAAKPK